MAGRSGRVRRLVLFGVSTFLSAAPLGYTEAEHPPRALQPLVVLIERNNWLVAVGSGSPTFALYENGLVIFVKRNSEGDAQYVSAMLGEEAATQFLLSLPTKPFNELGDEYTVSDWTDQPTNLLYLWTGDRLKRVSVYGNIRDIKEADLPESPDESLRAFLVVHRETRSKIPDAFRECFDRLMTYENPAAGPWVPERLEVMLWPYEHSSEEPARWPEAWPDTKHQDTRRQGDAYSIFLGAGELEALKTLLGSLGEKQAVLINDRKWSISYRFPFPNEQLWM